MLAALKKEKLVLDWRKKQQAQAKVRLTIEETLWGLVPICTEEQCHLKCEAVY